jgi:hypothetical protein
MDKKYLIFGALGLGGVVLLLMMRGGTSSSTTTTASIPTTTTGTTSATGGTVADIPDLAGVDWVPPANTPLTVINELIAAGFTPQSASGPTTVNQF